MAQFNFEGPKKATPKADTKPASKTGFTGPTKKPLPVVAPQSPNEMLELVLDFMRGFNDTLTFGMYDDIQEATGIDRSATEKLADANPIAKTLGEMGGYVVPGMGASKVASKIPGLVSNTIPSIIAREGLASGGLSAVDDVVRTGELDPGGILLDTLLGGVISGGVAGVGRISPEARVRAAGNELSPIDKARMKEFGFDAESRGIELSVPEIADAVAPGRSASIRNKMINAETAPKGAAAVREFNEARTPGVQAAGRSMVEEILDGKPMMTGGQSMDAAIDAIERVRSGFKTTADPYYASAEPKKLPPNWVPKGGATGVAKKYVADSPTFQKGLGGAANNSIEYLDAVKKRMDDMITGKTPNEDTFVGDEIRELLKPMDAVAPEYATARDITSQGKNVVDELVQGPLGTMSKTTKAATQDAALINPANTAELGQALEAQQLLGPDVPANMLARHIDDVTAKNPLTYGSKVSPTMHSDASIESILSAANKGNVGPTLEKARAVRAKDPDPIQHESSGWSGSLWQAIRDIGQGGVAEKLLDRRYIDRLGKMGPVQKAATSAGRSAVLTAANERKRKKKKKEPISIFVGGGNNSRP